MEQEIYNVNPVHPHLLQMSSILLKRMASVDLGSHHLGTGRRLPDHKCHRGSPEDFHKMIVLVLFGHNNHKPRLMLVFDLQLSRCDMQISLGIAHFDRVFQSKEQSRNSRFNIFCLLIMRLERSRRKYSIYQIFYLCILFFCINPSDSSISSQSW